jgi:hypothetical protein
LVHLYGAFVDEKDAADLVAFPEDGLAFFEVKDLPGAGNRLLPFGQGVAAEEAAVEVAGVVVLRIKYFCPPKVEMAECPEDDRGRAKT